MEVALVGLLIQWLVVAGSLLLVSKVIPGFRIKDFKTALIAAVILGLLNIFLRPILQILALPITIVTLGAFYFVVNALVLKLAASLVKDFEIEGCLPALLGALIISILGALAGGLFPGL
jgi:putative membrane protein